MKTQIILSLYEDLISGRLVKRKKFCKDYEISERTFYRYLREISIFLMKSSPEKVLCETEGKGEYYLKHVKTL